VAFGECVAGLKYSTAQGERRGMLRSSGGGSKARLIGGITMRKSDHCSITPTNWKVSGVEEVSRGVYSGDGKGVREKETQSWARRGSNGGKQACG